MNEEKIKRINELARKAKAEGLTEAETKERDLLRKEYIEAVRRNLRGQLENMSIVDSDGTVHEVKSKKRK